MPRYFFHIREGAVLTRDSRGQDLPDVETARDEAITIGESLMSERPDLLHRAIEIVDQTGRVVDEINSRDILFHHAYPGISRPAPENSPRR
ncbi:MAG TPA: hypothetical protein VH189_07610 [Rhizomicrobium sp.]|jgi:hypothetical protein|nr:hypothetical protein [Rhizomicrobium sp.]